MLSTALGLAVVLAVSAPVAVGAQDSLALRERALVSAVLFVRRSAAEDLRTVPADSIVIDGSKVLERPVISPEVMAQLAFNASTTRDTEST
jgi:hypothetical protein